MQNKMEKLKQTINDITKQDSCLAFSGGIDSSLLLRLMCDAAAEKGTKVYAVTFHTFLHPFGDLDIAKRVAREMGAEHHILKINELDNQDILHNPPERCYLCKKFLFETLQTFASERNISVIAEGTNEDDLHVYRPGLRALRELGINSPLAVCGFTKEEVRSYARSLGISVADRPSSPCMATRLPYGTKIELADLEKIEAAETYLSGMGFGNVRVRLHNEIARIEVDLEQMDRLISKASEVSQTLKKIGFPYIALDLEGFRSGSMDEQLPDYKAILSS